MRLKIDVTPFWWKIEAKNPETFAEWCVKAMRVILSVWPRAEVRLSRESLFAAVTFDGALRVGQALDEKIKIRMMLAAIVGMDDMQPKVSDRSDALPPVWEEMARRTGKPFGEGGAYASDNFSDWRGCVKLLHSRGMSLKEAEELLRSKHMRWCADESHHPYGHASVEDFAKSLEGM